MSRPTFRGKCWKVLLGKGEISCEEYVALVREGPSHMHHKIVVDAGRTFARDHEFCRRVPPEKLTRGLNAAMRRLESRLGAEHAVYVQGMNAVCGILLNELNEVARAPRCPQRLPLPPAAVRCARPTVLRRSAPAPRDTLPDAAGRRGLRGRGAARAALPRAAVQDT